jgi:uncharacterized protein (DUF111 family)
MNELIIDPRCGMAGDMFCAALMALGILKPIMLDFLKQVAANLGKTKIEVVQQNRQGLEGLLLDIKIKKKQERLEAARAIFLLQEALQENKIKQEYSAYALSALDILIKAETESHRQISPSHHMHQHAVHLHEAQDIIIDLAGAALGLQLLDIDLKRITCLIPVMTGGGSITFSHGTFAVPAPATACIIKDYSLPVAAGPVPRELFTPTGAALLAALKPDYKKRDEKEDNNYARQGVGFGTLKLAKHYGLINALFLYVKEK